MTIDERLMAIAAKQIPIPESGCAAKQVEMNAIRKMRVRRLRDQLNGLTADQVEEKITEWEQ